MPRRELIHTTRAEKRGFAVEVHIYLRQDDDGALSYEGMAYRCDTGKMIGKPVVQRDYKPGREDAALVLLVKRMREEIRLWPRH